LPILSANGDYFSASSARQTGLRENTEDMMISRYIPVAAFALALSAGAANAKIPFFNATCPGKLDIHADDGGPIYINGKEGKLKVFNPNYYEAKVGHVTISLTIRPDGSPDVSYTGQGGANGVCTLK
jgi:hypothetical protein